MRGAWIFNRTFDGGYGALVGGWFCSLLQPRGFIGQSVGPLVPYNAHVARDPLNDDLAVERVKFSSHVAHFSAVVCQSRCQGLAISANKALVTVVRGVILQPPNCSSQCLFLFVKRGGEHPAANRLGEDGLRVEWSPVLTTIADPPSLVPSLAEPSV